MLNQCLLLWAVMAASTTDHWPAFLGAGATDHTAAELPLTWSPSNNVAWVKTIPGHGQSSPVVWGDRVFVTSVEGPMKDTYHTLCFDRDSGEERWRRSTANSTPVKNSYYVSRAAPTPVVDQQHVIAFFESGDCVAYDHDGNQVWQRKLGLEEGPLIAEFGLGASPCQNETHLFVLLEHDGPSCLIALDKWTGETQWKADRSPRRSWSSPAMIRVADVPHVVVSSAGTVDGYSPDSGELLWSFDDIGGNTATTPIDFGDGRFLIGASPGRSGEATNSSADSNGLLQVTRQGDGWHVSREWVATGATPSWASPIIYGGFAYWVNRGGVVSCFDATDGTAVYTQRTKQSCWATPYGVGDRVYFFGKDGLVTVLAAGAEFKILAENQSWDKNTLPSEPRLSEESSPERQQGVAMFSQPTLYGVAVVSDGFLLRVGNALIRIR